MSIEKKDILALERIIRLSLIIGDDNVYIDRFKYLVGHMRIMRTDVYIEGKNEYVCYIPNGGKMTNWAFYLNETDNSIYINETFWRTYHSIFDRVNLDEIFIYFRILILSHFNLEKRFESPSMHISFRDTIISNIEI
jgi:hypothetical protein